MNPRFVRFLPVLASIAPLVARNFLTKRACAVVAVGALLAGTLYPGFDSVGDAIAAACAAGYALPPVKRFTIRRRD